MNSEYNVNNIKIQKSKYILYHLFKFLIIVKKNYNYLKYLVTILLVMIIFCFALPIPYIYIKDLKLLVQIFYCLIFEFLFDFHYFKKFTYFNY